MICREPWCDLCIWYSTPYDRHMPGRRRTISRRHMHRLVSKKRRLKDKKIIRNEKESE